MMGRHDAVVGRDDARGSLCAGSLDVHRPRAMRAGAIAELAVQVVAPAESLTGGRDAAVVRTEGAKRRERVITRHTNRNRAVVVGVVAKLSVYVAAPAPRVASSR